LAILTHQQRAMFPTTNYGVTNVETWHGFPSQHFWSSNYFSHWV